MFATILSGVLMNRWDSLAKMAVLDCPVMSSTVLSMR